MKNSIAAIFIVIVMTLTACSSTRDTKRADPRDQAYIPERHKNQDADANAPGQQKDEIREKHTR